jgi:hypothetical protein
MMVLVNLDGAPCALPSELDTAQAVYADGLLDDGRLEAYGSIVARCG